MRWRQAGLIFGFLAALAGWWLGAAPAGVVWANYGQCDCWECDPPEWCGECKPPGWKQHCKCPKRCGEGDASCGPGYYVCNREGNCCPVGDGPTPPPGEGGHGGCTIPTHKNLKVDWNYSATKVRFWAGEPSTNRVTNARIRKARRLEDVS